MAVWKSKRFPAEAYADEKVEYFLNKLHHYSWSYAKVVCFMHHGAHGFIVFYPEFDGTEQ